MGYELFVTRAEYQYDSKDHSISDAKSIALTQRNGQLEEDLRSLKAKVTALELAIGSIQKVPDNWIKSAACKICQVLYQPEEQSDQVAALIRRFWDAALRTAHLNAEL